MEWQTLLPFKSKTRTAGDFGRVGHRGRGLLLQNCQHLNGSPGLPFREEVWLTGTLCFLLIPGTTLVTQDWNAFKLEEACCSAVKITGRNSVWSHIHWSSPSGQAGKVHYVVSCKELEAPVMRDEWSGALSNICSPRGQMSLSCSKDKQFLFVISGQFCLAFLFVCFVLKLLIGRRTSVRTTK